MSSAGAEVVVDFGVAGLGSALVAGWSQPEPDETWTAAPVARISLPAPAVPATYVMTFKLRPQIVEGRLDQQRLGVSVNGVAIDEFVITRRTTRSCLLPWAVLRGRSSVDVSFDLPDAARPSDFGTSTDDRLLGVAFASLRLYPSLHDEWHSDNLSGPEPVAVDVASIMAADQMPLNRLMMQFESLGQNCEFGLLQRQCQAEPLGLLRFSSTPMQQLLTALEHRFEGLGAPGNLEIELSPNGREYMVKDTVFGFLYHAWVKAGEMEPSEVLRREQRRVPFLVRKLLEDLEDADKTFVFKGMGATAEEAVFPLAAALRRYGPNTLLFVNLADAEHRAGEVAARAPGFLVGHVSRFAPTENASDLALPEWVKLCRQAYRLRIADRA